MTMLQVENLTGGYSATRPVLHNITFHVNKGEMVGLVGLNGAGKSTTMKHILGLMQAKQGEIKIDGVTLTEAPEHYRSNLAYVPESPLLYDHLTVQEHLELTAMVYSIDPSVYQERTQRLLALFQMESLTDRFPMHLSKGMRQKVMLMCAFLAEPPLYLIDEPFLGLDPLGIRSLLAFMDEKRSQGAAILLSSHILSTIEHYCHSFILLHHGSVKIQGTLSDWCHESGLKEESLEDMFYVLVKGGA